ncbi:T9SS type A sorting domain-containing protein [Flavobacterium weaverense]
MLPQNNYKVEVTSASCIGSNNGKIQVTVADVKYVYTVSVTGQTPFTLNPINSSTKTFDNLANGSYSVCFKIEGKLNYEQCFDVVINQPAALKTTSKLNSKTKNLDLTLEGASSYQVTINGRTQTVIENKFSTQLLPGVNNVEVKTNLNCQGIYFEKIILYDDLTYYPNPTSGGLTIILPEAIKNINVYVRNTAGMLVLQKQSVPALNGVVNLDLSGLSEGTYQITTLGSAYEETFKIIKK